MNEHDRVALVERFEHRIERGIAQEFLAIAREQADALVLELIERMLDLGHRFTRHRTSARSTSAPKRFGQRALSSAEYSLQRRASAPAFFGSPNCTPGCASDISATSMPDLSIVSSASSGDQSG